MLVPMPSHLEVRISTGAIAFGLAGKTCALAAPTWSEAMAAPTAMWTTKATIVATATPLEETTTIAAAAVTLATLLYHLGRWEGGDASLEHFWESLNPRLGPVRIYYFIG